MFRQPGFSSVFRPFSLARFFVFFQPSSQMVRLFTLATFYDHISFIAAVTFAINTVFFRLNCYLTVFLSFLNKFCPIVFLPLFKKLFDLCTKVPFYGLFSLFIFVNFVAAQKDHERFRVLNIVTSHFSTMLESIASASFLSSLSIIQGRKNEISGMFALVFIYSTSLLFHLTPLEQSVTSTWQLFTNCLVKAFQYFQ